jgi:hypothetical protein
MGHRIGLANRHVAGKLAAALWVICLILFGALASTSGNAEQNPLRVCKDQIYALCAAAHCFVLNDVAYCKCDVEFGDSISLAFRFDDSDVCRVNAEGQKNGYMVSTFSVPPSIIKPDGNMAIYTCPNTSDGAYAQCDGGVCFRSTSGQRFPGFRKNLAQDEIICSCPITVADPSKPNVGYQIAGPYPCD